ncbi:hypothetical protein EXM22_06455 [Oceanispirochaeta crateris]|uniref:WD40 repeat domain-containing protein n=1 Tax=Oceanispirochaeta crateris TaxID=2518645 RepID=A0A5C1QM66_9SPIO|nr:hypothetical protein [Oceanispirochaeta crateris]QEN07646.1 hypothetical protein EXM22_06455 [Oceanispirochaeta crateris]
MKYSLVLIFFSFSCLCYGEDSILNLQKIRSRGDFISEQYVIQDGEHKLSLVSDPTERTILKRQLYLEDISLPESLFFDTQISALSADGDDIWLGSRSGDIARYSLSERKWTSFVRGEESLAIRMVQSIQIESERIWFLSYGSVAIYSKRHDRFIQLSIPDDQEYRGLQSAVLMGQGLISGTQSSNLRRIRLDSQSVIQQTPSLRNITFLKDLKNGTLLAGTEMDGLFILDEYFQPRPLSENNRKTSAVRAVLGDPDVRMIGGSYGAGLFQLVRQGEGYDIVFLHTPVQWITDGVEIKGEYYFSSLGQGLVVLDGETLQSRFYGISEGLSGLDINALVYVDPYLICAVQGQGIIKIHENYFKTP